MEICKALLHKAESSRRFGSRFLQEQLIPETLLFQGRLK
jgi:hypothetical protein